MSEDRIADLFLDMAGDPQLKRKFLEDPKGVLAGRGMPVPEGVSLRVLEDTETVRHIVLPHLSGEGGGGPEEMAQRISKSAGPMGPLLGPA